MTSSHLSAAAQIANTIRPTLSCPKFVSQDSTLIAAMIMFVIFQLQSLVVVAAACDRRHDADGFGKEVQAPSLACVYFDWRWSSKSVQSSPKRGRWTRRLSFVQPPV